MSTPQPGQRLPTVPGFPPPRTYAEYQQQRQAYMARQGQASPSNVWMDRGKTMGMGFVMGMFVGGSVTLLHAAMSGGLKGINGMAVKRAVGGGTAFGVIFAVGSLVRQ